MALIVFTVADQADGTVEVNLKMEPTPLESGNEFTPAQKVAAAGMNAIHDMVLNLRTTHIDLSAAPSEQPPGKRKLTIVGADEMPL